MRRYPSNPDTPRNEVVTGEKTAGQKHSPEVEPADPKFERSNIATRLDNAHGSWEVFRVSDIHTNYVVSPTTADDKYKFLLLRVLGGVKSVGEDHIYLTDADLLESQEYEVKAYWWNEDDVEKGKTLKNFDLVAIRCQGDGREGLITVVLVSCTGLELVDSE